MKRIDYGSGLLFAAATVPGAIIGALDNALHSSPTVQCRTCLVMIVAAAYLSSPNPEAEDLPRRRTSGILPDMLLKQTHGAYLFL